MLDLSDAQVSLVLEDANPNTPTYHAAKHNELPIGLLSIPLDNGQSIPFDSGLALRPASLLAILLALWITRGLCLVVYRHLPWSLSAHRS